MSWTIQYLEPHGIIQVTISGGHTTDDVRQFAIEALAEGKRRGVNRYLSDERDTVPLLRTLEIYKVPAMLLELGATKSTRVAVVISSKSPKIGDYEFVQDVAYNYGGVSVKVFKDSIEAGLLWLQKDSD